MRNHIEAIHTAICACEACCARVTAREISAHTCVSCVQIVTDAVYEVAAGNATITVA